MNGIKSAKPLISAVVLLIALWVAVHVYLSVGSGIDGFAFLAVTSALLSAFFYYFYREGRALTNQVDFVENIPGLAWISEAGGPIRSMNSRMREFLQVPPGSLAVAPASIHPEDRRKTLDLWGPHHWSGEFGTHRLQGPDGRYHWFRSAVHPIRDENGAIVSLWGTFIDIGDLKEAEQALRSSEEAMRLILDNIPENVVTADANGVNDYCNRHSMIFYGRSFHEVNGSGFRQFIHPDDLEKFSADSFHCIKNAIPMDQPVRQLRHDGVYRWFRMRVNPAFDENGNVVRWYGLHIDIDDEVKATEALQDAKDRLAQASEHASLAELAASIAHEVNQPLSAMVTNSEACQLWLAADPPNLERARTSTDRIVRNAKEAANVVSRIRDLFAKRSPHKEPMDIYETIYNVSSLVRKKYASSNLTVNLDLDAAIPMMNSDRIQIHQLIFNLLRNGVEAMQANRDEPMTLDIKSRLAGETAIVEIADNGVGLVDTAKIFEPFFTTKSDGMGMGLSICRSIVNAHMGRLWAEGRFPRGATFAFALSVLDAAVLQDVDRAELSSEGDRQQSY